MTPGGGSTLNYTFDASSNLTTLPTGASTGYEQAGELTSSTLSGTTTSYMYNADGQRLTAKQGSTTVASATWNGAGKLTAYTDSVASMIAATYDGAGLRATAATSSAPQVFVWDTVGRLPLTIMDSSDAYIYAGGSTPAEQVSLSNGAVTYLVADSLGSVRGTVNSTGALTATTSYDAWGNPETPGGLSASTPFGYAGGYTDPDGLVYLINRYYDPGTRMR
jgi:YD repeat-containing protein